MGYIDCSRKQSIFLCFPFHASQAACSFLLRLHENPRRKLSLTLPCYQERIGPHNQFIFPVAPEATSNVDTTMSGKISQVSSRLWHTLQMTPHKDAPLPGLIRQRVRSIVVCHTISFYLAQGTISGTNCFLSASSKDTVVFSVLSGKVVHKADVQ